MTTFFILVFLVYSALLLWLMWGWFRLSRNNNPSLSNVKQHFISVIIPYRNEATYVSSMLNHLAAQTYSAANFEIIFVDDHSTDQSTELALQANMNHLTILQLPATEHGKKAALDLGIRHAKGEIIALSDMDCDLPSAWLMTINEGFSSANVKMLVGAVRIVPSGSLFSLMQALEFSSLIGTSGATLGWGKPTMSNGANLSFLKSAFMEVDGYTGNSAIPSGDDEFLMRKIAARWKDAVRFLYNREAVVSTSAQPTLAAFLHQRLRWASKWKYNSSFFTKVTALLVLAFHSCFLLFFAFLVLGKIELTIALGLLFSKLLMEGVFLFSITSFLSLRWSWISFLAVQFIHSFYVVATGILSQVKIYDWKGRRWNPLKN